MANDPRKGKIGGKYKRLPRQRFTASNSSANPQTQMWAIEEDMRRRQGQDDVVEGPAHVYAKPRAPQITTPPPDIPAIIDRFHKFGRVYVTVSPIHFPGMDPIEDPAAFHNIMDAYNFAHDVLAPLFDAFTRNRIIIEVHGGYYEENLIVEADIIDFQGIGKVIVNGVHLVTPGSISYSNRINLIDITLCNLSVVGSPALSILPMGDYPATEPAEINIDRCHIYGIGGGLYSVSGRVNCWRSILETSYESGLYTNIDEPAIELGKTSSYGYSLFEDCDIIGLQDNRASAGAVGYPNKGCAIKIGGVAAPWALSGALFSNCRIEGYAINEYWNIVFDHCKIYGGKKHATAGTLFLFLVGDSDVPVTGEVEFDHCKVVCRYLVEESDVGAVPTNGQVVERILHTKQMSYGAADSSVLVAGSTCWNIFGLYGTAILGNTYVTHSSSWRDFWNFLAGPGDAALSILMSAPNANAAPVVPSNPIAAVTSQYIHWG